MPGMNKKPMNKGMKALKKKAPEVAKKMGYKKGGMVPDMKLCPSCPTPAKCKAAGKCLKGKAAKRGYAKGGYVNCGASMKPGQKR